MIPAYDLLSPLGLPELKNARGIGFYPNRFANPSDVIYVMSGEGTYKLDKETFKTDESWNINNVDFIIPPVNENVIYYTSVNRSEWLPMHGCCFWLRCLFADDRSSEEFKRSTDDCLCGFHPL